jgi:hypothetical protein
VADALLFPPTTLLATPSKGDLPPAGSLGAISPTTVRLLSAKLTGDQRISVRAQNRGTQSVEATMRIGTSVHSLGILAPQEITTVELPLTRM